jgi:TPR repeat protein
MSQTTFAPRDSEIQQDFEEDMIIFLLTVEDIFASEVPLPTKEQFDEFNGEKIFRIGVNFQQGKAGFLVNLDKARICFEFAAHHKSHGKSFHKLALRYEEGDYFPEDFSKAKEHYEKAIEFGCSPSLNNLAILYDGGYGMERDVKVATDLYERAIKTGCKNAMYNLAKNYETGEHGFEKDEQKAFSLYKLGVKHGDRDAMFQLALCLEEGIGCAEDIPRAIKLYTRAIKRNEFDSIYNLGLLYRSMDEYGLAREVFEEGVQRGCMKCTNSLAMIYKDALDVEKDMKKSLIYLEMSILRGNYKAMENLGDLLYHGVDIPLNYTEAKRMYDMALWVLVLDPDFEDGDEEEATHLQNCSEKAKSGADLICLAKFSTVCLSNLVYVDIVFLEN